MYVAREARKLRLPVNIMILKVSEFLFALAAGTRYLTLKLNSIQERVGLVFMTLYPRKRLTYMMIGPCS